MTTTSLASTTWLNKILSYSGQILKKTTVRYSTVTLSLEVANLDACIILKTGRHWLQACVRGVPYYFTPVTVSKMFVASLTGSRKRHKERVFKYAMYLGKYRSSAEIY